MSVCVDMLLVAWCGVLGVGWCNIMLGHLETLVIAKVVECTSGKRVDFLNR